MEYTYPCYKDITTTVTTTITSGHNDLEEQCNATVQCPCGDASKAEVAYYEDVKFWLEAVAVPSVGGVGLICNVAAIPVLLSR